MPGDVRCAVRCAYKQGGATSASTIARFQAQREISVSPLSSRVGDAGANSSARRSCSSVYLRLPANAVGLRDAWLHF